MNELQLIASCKQRDQRALRTVYERYAGKMLAVCRRYVNDLETAQDLMHDGFITVFEKMDEFRGDGSFEGWMRRIFVNTALGHLRKKDTLQEAEDIDLHYDIASVTPSALQSIEAEELMRCIEQLPPGYRTVLNLFAIEGYSHKEIAAQMGISEETSRSQFFRAKALLQKIIQRNQ